MARCQVCFRHCEIREGEIGFCGARSNMDGAIMPVNYGLVTSLALDPIEKKPLRRFLPGSMILSVGSYGCNLRCPFCQNNSISWSEGTMDMALRCRAAAEGIEKLPRGVEYCSPDKLVFLAKQFQSRGNIGLAFTYNEPLVGYEFVRDAARLAHEQGLKNVMVTNGTAEPEILEELLPWIDGMNIDLKSFSDKWYGSTLSGSLSQVRSFIRRAVQECHVELTTLIVPGENDSEEELKEMTEWIASLTDKTGASIGRRIPLHISRFFPQFHMTDRPPTDVEHIYRLADIAREKLDYVYTGNC